MISMDVSQFEFSIVRRDGETDEFTRVRHKESGMCLDVKKEDSIDHAMLLINDALKDAEGSA